MRSWDSDGFLAEGKKYAELGEPVQASEKLYKAAEEAVEALSRPMPLRFMTKL